MFFRRSTLGKAVVSFKPLTSSKELPSMLFDGQEKHWEPQVLSSEPFLFRPPPRHSASLNRVTRKNQLTSTLVIYIPYITLHRSLALVDILMTFWWMIIIDQPLGKWFYIQVFIILFASTLYYYFLFISTNKNIQMWFFGFLHNCWFWFTV